MQVHRTSRKLIGNCQWSFTQTKTQTTKTPSQSFRTSPQPTKFFRTPTREGNTTSVERSVWINNKEGAATPWTHLACLETYSALSWEEDRDNRENRLDPVREWRLKCHLKIYTREKRWKWHIQDRWCVPIAEVQGPITQKTWSSVPIAVDPELSSKSNSWLPASSNSSRRLARSAMARERKSLLSATCATVTRLLRV